MMVTGGFITTLAAAGDFAGVALSLLFLLVLVGQPAGRTPANMALAGAALVFGLCLADDFLGAQGLYRGLPRDLACIGNALPSLIGPLVYLHVEAQVSPEGWRPGRRHWRHGGCFLALSAFLVLALVFPVPPGLPVGAPSASLLARLLFLVMSSLGAYAITAAQGLYYLFRAIRLTRPGGTGDEIRLSWLRLLLQAMAALWLLYVADDGMQLVLGRPTATNALFAIGYVLLLYGMAWISLHHGAAFRRTPSALVEGMVAPLAKYRKSAQTDADAARLVAKIETALAQERLFQDNGLSLDALARSVGARPNAVSQAINQHLGVNYFDFVNRYRVEEAKKLLHRPDGETGTILDIAFAVGFNSKSTFNAAFKKFAGLTPSDFRKRPPER
jgi:AraC-like DNA-binding protein